MHHQHCFNGCVLRRSSRENAISAQVEFENTAGWRAPTALILPETSPPHPKSSPELPNASPKRPQSVPRVFPERPRSAPGERRLEVTKSHLARVSRCLICFCTFFVHAKLPKSGATKGGPGSYSSTRLANILAAQKARPGARAELKKTKFRLRRILRLLLGGVNRGGWRRPVAIAFGAFLYEYSMHFSPIFFENCKKNSSKGDLLFHPGSRHFFFKKCPIAQKKNVVFEGYRGGSCTGRCFRDTLFYAIPA